MKLTNVESKLDYETSVNIILYYSHSHLNRAESFKYFFD